MVNKTLVSLVNNYNKKMDILSELKEYGEVTKAHKAMFATIQELLSVIPDTVATDRDFEDVAMFHGEKSCVKIFLYISKSDEWVIEINKTNNGDYVYITKNDVGIRLSHKENYQNIIEWLSFETHRTEVISCADRLIKKLIRYATSEVRKSIATIKEKIVVA